MNQINFVRQNGVFGGVCGGLAARLDVPVFILRAALLLSFFFTFGFTFLIYIAAIVSYPSELTAGFPEQPKFLGVCHRLAPKLGIHENSLRFLTLIGWIFTAFLPVFAGYMILFLVNVSTDQSSGGQTGFRDVN